MGGKRTLALNHFCWEAIHRLTVNEMSARIRARLSRKRPMEHRLKQEAEECRGRAVSYLGRPEATFLLRVAREFDRLATIKSKEDPEDGESTNGR